MSIDFSDHGMDPQNEKIMESFNQWANNLPADKFSQDMDNVPDTVALFAGLQVAVRKTALLAKRNMMTKQQAIQMFSNFLEEIQDGAAQA